MTAQEQEVSPTNDHVRQSARFFGVMLGGPFFVGLVSSWSAGFGFILFLFGSPVLIGVLLVGGVLFVIRGISAARRSVAPRDRTINVLAAPVLMVITFLLAWPSLGAGSFSGTWTRLMVNRSHYETIITKVKRGHRAPSTTSSFEEDGGVEYVVDAGPPVRVAFNPEGMLDNWSGIIFDPTGEVMMAKGFDPATGKFAAPERVTKLFGGDLVSCRHLWARYYDCSFT
jgi:hypothetical protein